LKKQKEDERRGGKLRQQTESDGTSGSGDCFAKRFARGQIAENLRASAEDRNTSYEIEKSEQEQKRAKEKEINNVEDVWKRGMATVIKSPGIFWACARRGFDASPVRIANARRSFFAAA